MSRLTDTVSHYPSCDADHFASHTHARVPRAIPSPTHGASTSTSPPLPPNIRPKPHAHRPFPGGVGKTWEPGAFEELLGDVSSQLFGVYGDDTVVYPGHGDDTTLGDERPHLEEWRERGW